MLCALCKRGSKLREGSGQQLLSSIFSQLYWPQKPLYIKEMLLHKHQRPVKSLHYRQQPSSFPVAGPSPGLHQSRLDSRSPPPDQVKAVTASLLCAMESYNPLTPGVTVCYLLQAPQLHDF